jgi:hypothetical protein
MRFNKETECKIQPRFQNQLQRRQCHHLNRCRVLSRCRPIRRRSHRSDDKRKIAFKAVLADEHLARRSCSARLEARRPSQARCLTSDWRKQEPQRRFNPRRPGRFAVIGAFDFEITKIDTGPPTFVD